MKKTVLLWPALLIALLTQSCAVSYYSEETSTLHVFGFGHVAMRVPESGPQSVYHQLNTYGISAGTTREGGHLDIGYVRNTVLDIANDETLCFQWPSTDLMEVRVGKGFPGTLPEEECTDAD